MGGNTFDLTVNFTINDYKNFSELIKKNFIENVDYFLPLRLDNKNSYGDYDLIVNDTEKFIKLFNSLDMIKDIKIVYLFEAKYNMYSKHILDKNNR